MLYKIIAGNMPPFTVFENIELFRVLSILEEHRQIPGNPFQDVLQPLIEQLTDSDAVPVFVWEKFLGYTSVCDEYAMTLSSVLTKKIDANNNTIKEYLEQRFNGDLEDIFLDRPSTSSYSDQDSSGSRGAHIPPADFLGVINPKKEGDNFLTLMYSEPPHDIQQSSQMIFGDKLYGNQENRDTLLPALRKQFGANILYRDAFTIDEYNALLNIEALSLGERDVSDFRLPENHDISHLQSIAFKAFSMRVLTEKGKVFTNDTHDRIKKSCKLGIDFVRETGQKIHFVLPDASRLDQEAIVLKTEGNGQSITASELRKTYREWDLLCHTVVFYREVVNRESDSDHSRKSEFSAKVLEPTAAPWETDAGRQLWSQYAHERKR